MGRGWERATVITPSFATPTSDASLFGSFTEDKDYIWFVHPTGHEVGVSEDAGATWTQKTDVPVDVISASGYPSDNAFFLVGRDEQAWYPDDPDIIYASYDAAATWTDKTGNLLEQMDGFISGSWGRTSIVTIAPDW